MAVEPIHVAAEEELPTIIERIRRSRSDEVRLILPAHSRIGQSRFNFQLLRQYTMRLGKRVAVLTPDPAMQRLAEESGFVTLQPSEQPARADGQKPGPWARGTPAAPPGQPLRGPRFEGPVAASTGLAAASGGAGPAAGTAAAGAASPIVGRLSSIGQMARNAAPAVPRIRIGAPQRLPARLATRIEPLRHVFYVGAGLLLLLGIAAMVFYVPSAQVTLVAQATPFSTHVDFGAAPGSPPVKVRVVPVTRQMSVSLPATGNKMVAGQVASGQFTYVNACPFGLLLANGQRLRASNGVVFAQVGGDAALQPGSTATVAIKATTPGQNGNLGSGQITGIEANQYSCLTGGNVAPTTGGSDGQKKTVIQNSDLVSARARMEQTLRQQVTQDLTKGAQAGEKLASPPWFDPSPTFTPDHNVDDEVQNFTATMSVKAEGAYFELAEVTQAFTAALQKKVPADQQLTTNKVAMDYTMTTTQGGHIEFSGTASGFIAPRIDLDKLTGQLAGKPTSQARADLGHLPIRSSNIEESPLPLPVMPFSSSRIHIEYDEASAASSAAPSR